MTTVSTQPQLYVFVMPPGSVNDSNRDPQVTFPWAWSTWVLEPRLIPESATVSAGSVGSARFRLTQQKFAEYTQGFDTPDTFIVPGCWVCVCRAVVVDETLPDKSALPDPAKIDWIGKISSVDMTPQPEQRNDGTVEALEIGAACFDNIRVNGFVQWHASEYTRRIVSPPTANLSDGGTGIIGNAILQTTGGNNAYVFARDLSQYGTDPANKWTPWRLLCHIFSYCKPGGLPPMRLTLEDGSGVTGEAYKYSGHTSLSLADYLDDPGRAEVWNLSGLTLRGALDLLAGPGLGLGWRIENDGAGANKGIKVVLYSRSAMQSRFGAPKTGADNYPVSTSIVPTDDNTVSVDISEDDSARFDEVIVRGARHVFGVSLSKIDDNLDQGWTAAQETAYGAATGNQRTSPQYGDVFRSYILKRQTADQAPTVSETPGAGSVATRPLCPEVAWTPGTRDRKGTASISSRAFEVYLPALRFASEVPWIDTAAPTGGGPAVGVATQTPRLMSARVFTNDSAQTPPWKDLLSRNKTSSFTPLPESPQVDMDDARPGVRVSYTRPHALGLNTFTGTETNDQAAVLDWRKLLVTVGVPSDQRLEVSRQRASAQLIQKSLVIEDDIYAFAATLKGTVVGVNTDNSDAVRVAEDTIIRNDYEAAQTYCDAVAEWAFRRKITAIVTVPYADGPSTKFLPGITITQVIDGQKSYQVNSNIATVTIDWQAGRITVATELPPQPNQWRGGASSSPSAGGPISVELGGTVSQIVQQQQKELEALRRMVSARPLIPAMGGGAVPKVPLYEVVDGPVSTFTGIPGAIRRDDQVAGSEMPVGTGGSSGDIITVPTLPLPSGLPDGIGVCQSLSDGSRTWFVIDNRSPDIVGDLPIQRRIYGWDVVNLDRVSGGVTYRYPCLIVAASI